MTLKMFVSFALGGLLAGASQAAISVDGSLDAGYGAAKSHVSYNAAAPVSNFGTPTSETNQASYDIYLASDSSYVYGYFQAANDAGIAGTFANLYFDSDLSEANGVGSDLGFNISTGSTRAFVPNESIPVTVSGILVAQSGDGRGLEFAIPTALFTSFIPGITYDAGVALPTAGSTIQLRLSQSFGYSVAGGSSYGSARLGEVTLGGAVPEPANWAMMVMGFGLLGAALRRRRTAVRFA